MEVTVVHANGSDSVWAPDGALPEGMLPGFVEGYALLDGVKQYVRVQDDRSVVVLPDPGLVLPRAVQSAE